MPHLDLPALRVFVDTIPQNYKGPGGVVAVVKDGEVVLSNAWGFADLRTRQPMTAQTRMPICSVSKQFTCGVLLDSVGEPEALDDALRTYLADFVGERPRVRDLNPLRLRPDPTRSDLTVLAGRRGVDVRRPAAPGDGQEGENEGESNFHLSHRAAASRCRG